MALLVNHLWPLMTHSSPSSTAVVCSMVGSAPAPEPACLLGLAAEQGEDLGVARIRRLVAEHGRRPHRGAQDLVHQAELALSVALPAVLGREVAGPEPAGLDLLLERTGEAREASE